MRLASVLSMALLLLRGVSAAHPAESLEILHAMTGAQGFPVGTAVLAPDGTVYGVTQYDGTFNGSIFALHPDGAGGFSYELLYAFHFDEGGYQPQAGLLRGSDGLLYGTTTAMVGSGRGSVFRFDPATRTLTTLHAFGLTDGDWPQGALIEGAGGVFYGTTRFGGDMNFGVVFRIDSPGSFTRLHSFSGSDGRHPFGRLYLAANGDLYGTTSRGGFANEGTVFRIDSQGVFGVLHAFQGYPTDGGVPKGGLTLAPDGKVYGTTEGGGTTGNGTLFRIVPPGTVEVVFEFQGSDGSGPHADLAVSSGDGTLVGTTNSGGANDQGTVYRVTLPGFVTTLHSFDGADGSTPNSGVAVASSGQIFGATSLGSPHGHGLVYQMNAAGSETVLHVFVPEGANVGAPLMQAADGKLYGPAPWQHGSIFQWDPVGSELKSIVTFKDPDIVGPTGGLVESGDGWFYGTSYGDPYSLAGAVYRAKLDGTSEPVHVFDGSEGARPYAGLIHASDGNYYGTTHDPAGGTFFKIDPQGAFASLTSFDIFTLGTGPCGRLLETSAGHFHGTLEAGGPAPGGGGSVFQIDNFGSADVVHGFTFGGSAYIPCSDLTWGSDGFFYGTTIRGTTPGGQDARGAVFRVSSSGDETTLCQFHGPDGAEPLAGVTESAPGVFYGTTTAGGAADRGTIFRVDSTGRCDSVYAFDGPLTGSYPRATMLRASDGYLYGTTQNGGWWGGTLFRFSGGTPAVTVSPTSGPAGGGTPFTVAGSRFQDDATILVGSAPAQNPDIVSATFATGTTPALPPGTLHHVLVLNPDRSSGMVIDGWLADFLDVPQADPFHAFIETVVRRHVAAGYGDGRYGRDDSVTRAQMAVLLLKSKHGSGYVPPPCAGAFGDTPCPGPFTDWVEQLAAEGIAAGCGAGNFCPGNAVRRDQMAPFLLKAKHGSGYVAPPCAGVFPDVPCPGLFADWIEQLAAEAISAGCGGAHYCPSSPNTRAQMAVFLVKTFALN